MKCDCQTYQHLELYREAIDKRIRKSKKIKKTLEMIANKQNENSLLWQCPICNQLWQSGYAWNWGAKEYFYKIPDISVEDWLEEPFVKPDELLIYSAVLSQFEGNSAFVESDAKCKKDECNQKAIQYSVFCKKHHIESLQNAKAIPKFPKGRIFDPYFEK